MADALGEEGAVPDQHYRLVFERNPIPMWVYDDETLCFLAVNDAAVAQYGWSREEFLAKTIADIRPPEDLGQLHEARQSPRDALNPVREPFRHFHRDGSLRDVEITSHGITWDGRRARFVAAYDVTERVAAERAVRVSEARLSGLVGSAMDAIISVDQDFRIILFNAAAERIFGITSAEVIGGMLDRFLPMRFRGAHAEAIRLFGEYGTTNRSMGALSRLTAVRADGTEFPIEATISKVKIEGRWIFTVILRDITLRLSLEEQLRQAQRLEAVGLLAGGIAHDFNNLLSAINGYLELLDPAVKDEQGRADLVEVQAAAGRAAQLTRQLLMFSRKNVLRPRLLDPNEIVRGVQKLLRRLISEDILLDVDLAVNAGEIVVDPGQLEQVLMNLAVNARDAMPNGGRLTIRTRHAKSDAIGVPLPDGAPHEWVVLEVSDDGSGMSAEIMQRAFDPFFTTKAEGRGTGLGLATVRAIADQAQGVAWIESTPGMGTRVFVAFPSAIAPEVRESRVQDAAAEHAPGGKGLRVLLVEDDESVRAISTRLLRWRGHSVTTAASGVEGLLRSREAKGAGAPFDVIVTDVIMPEMGGRELVRQLRLEQPSMAVVYCSGYTGESRDEVEADAASELLGKPFTSEQLDEAITRARTKVPQP